MSRRLLALKLATLLLVEAVCSADLSTMQASVLSALKRDLSPFQQLMNWPGRNGNPCGWVGVTCNTQGHVTTLNFQAMTVSLPDGAEPAPLALLTPHLLKLPKLQSLILTEKFGGNLPPEWVQLASVRQLQLWAGVIEGGLPDAWGNGAIARSLQELDLSGNARLTGTLPASWGSGMAQLRRLDLSFCALRGTIPATWGIRWGVLETLRLNNNNNLGGRLPESFGNLSRLVTLDLSGGNFWGSIPRSYGPRWQRLRELRLDDNPILGGQLPWEFGRGTPSLSYLDISNCNFSGSVPGTWGTSWSRMTHLDVSGNTLLGGQLPPSWSNMTQLTWMAAARCAFKGPLSTPWRWPKWSLLETLDLHGNPKLGPSPLPVSWGTLSKLRILDLSNGNWMGTVPYTWGQAWPNLFALSLGGNRQVNGTLPAALGNLGALQTLDVEGCNFSGTIPSTYGSNWTVLQELSFANNPRLGGQLPSSWSKDTLPLLGFLDLHNSNFSGSVPYSWGPLYLQTSLLDPSGNRLLTGCMPSEWNQWSSADRLSSRQAVVAFVEASAPAQTDPKPVPSAAAAPKRQSGSDAAAPFAGTGLSGFCTGVPAQPAPSVAAAPAPTPAPAPVVQAPAPRSFSNFWGSLFG